MKSYNLSMFDNVPVTLSPPLKWAGGKRWLIPTLQPLWEQHTHRRLVEPFVGGMAVALGLQPHQALLNDANPHLINFYCWLQRGLVIELDLVNDKEVYYQYRKRFNSFVHTEKAHSAEAASLFYYLNRTGFNGLCRFNSKGKFNVPKGSYKTINYTYDFTAYSSLLGRWDFVNKDFSEVKKESSDFIYADPPYDVEFTTYSAGGFSWEDQVRLAEWLGEHDGPVVVSNQATERILDLYRGLGFNIQLLQGPRRIACTGDRSPAEEMLATKNL